MKWLVRLFLWRNGYRLPRPPRPRCNTTCLFCGKTCGLVRTHPVFRLLGVCEDCADEVPFE